MLSFQEQFLKIAEFEEEVKNKITAIKKLNGLDNLNELLDQVDQLREFIFKAKCEAEIK